MASQPVLKAPNRRNQRRGLDYWADRVLKEFSRARKSFDPDAVHDLRVALRRCRSIARGMKDLDPHPAWRKLDKSSKKLFKSLGELRDSQILLDWVKRLGGEEDAVWIKMLDVLTVREQEAKAEAQKALDKFDPKLWRRRSSQLAERAHRVAADGLAFQHLALELWELAHALHRRALRTRSRVAYHRCRIGIKRLRYTTENFLPRRSAGWNADLKKLQDALGDAHDLDVLRIALRAVRPAFDAALLAGWLERIEQVRRERLKEYHQKTTGKNSLWPAWRRHLPSGKRLESAAMAKLEAWASFLDPDFRHARHVSDLSLQLFDSLRSAGFDGVFSDSRFRKILYAAALLHDVGRSRGEKNHHKSSYRIIRDLQPPLGWSRDDIGWVALVARYHRGAEPQAGHEGYGALSPTEQRKVAWLAGVLRLADSLDADRSGKITRLHVSNLREALVVRVEGCGDESILSTPPVMEKKRLLETCAGRPVIVQPLAPHPAVAA
jgi:CHAD domain-containing protein